MERLFQALRIMMSQVSEASEEEVLAKQRERERRIQDEGGATAADEADEADDMVDVVVDAGGFSRGPYGRGMPGGMTAMMMDAESANDEFSTFESESESAWEADYNDDGDDDDEPHF